MAPPDIEPATRLIRRAMSTTEARQALETFHFHFGCEHHGLEDGRTYYVLPDSTSIRGLVGLHRYIWGPPENVWLAWFAVDPDLQGQGLGSLLLQAVVREAQSRAFSKLFVETYSTPEFDAARRFYRSHAFVEVGSIESYLPCGGDMVVFCRHLTPTLYATRPQGRSWLLSLFRPQAPDMSFSGLKKEPSCSNRNSLNLGIRIS